jgi:hypothetical protein
LLIPGAIDIAPVQTFTWANVSDDSKGIFNYLGQRIASRLNPHSLGIVEITSDTHMDNSDAFNLIDGDGNTQFHAIGSEDSHFVRVRFKKRKAKIVRFVMMAIALDVGFPGYINDAVFEGSNDDQNWTLLHTISGAAGFSYNSAIFESDSYEYYRWTQGLANFWNMASLEVFGDY